MNSIKALFILFILALFTNASPIYGQSVVKEKNLNNGTIEEQFDYIIKNSNRYQDYKVIKRVWLDKVKSNVSDSIDVIKKDLLDVNQQLSNQKSEIDLLQNQLRETNDNLTQSNNQKERISFFGIPMKKASYKSIMWAIIAGLGSLLAFFIMRFLRSNSLTAQTKKSYQEISEEFEDYKQKAMENEQVLRRKLQDEVNKRL